MRTNRSGTRAIVIVLLAILVAGLTACGGGDGSSSSTEDGSSSSTKAFRWDVSLATSRQPACFKPGSPLLLTVVAFDTNGRPISDPSYEVASDVPGAIEAIGPGGWTVRGEGAARITVTYTGATDPGSTITPVTLDVLRDGTAPRVAIHQPARGAMVTASGDVRVQGQAIDASSPIHSLTVNGIEQVTTAALDHAIDFTSPGRWGLNVIEAAATDSCGNTAALSQSYLLSQGYRPAATAANVDANVARGQSLKLTQAAVDDLDRNDVDDLATLVERHLQRNLSNELAQQTSGALIASAPAGCPGAGYTLAVAAPGATATGPRVRDIVLGAGSIRERLSAERVTVPLRFVQITRIGIPLTGCTTTSVPFSATVSANVTSDSTSVATVTGNGRIDVSVPSIAVQLADVRLTLTGVSAIDSILSSLINLMTGFIEDAMEDLIRSELPPLIEDFLNAPLTASTTISGGPFNMTMSAVAAIDGIDVIPAATTETAYTQIHPASAGTPYPALGSIARPTAAANLTANPGPLTYAIDDNLINQGLWALWHGGAMEIPDVIGFPGAALRVSALLPPVLMPGAQADKVAFGVGDLKVELNLDHVPNSRLPISGQVQVEAYVSYVLDGNIEYDSATRDLRLQATPDNRRTYVHVTRISNGTDDITDAAQRAQVKAYAERLISRSAELLADETLVSILLPPLRFEFDQPAAGTVDALELEIKRLARTADHVVIDMAFKADAPPLSESEIYLTLNNPWTGQDLVERKIPEEYRDSTTHIEDPDATLIPSRSITLFDYRHTTRPQCNTAGNSPEGKPICLPEWRFPLNYGWYCGADRPVVGWTENPRLDAVDYCCLLHDRTIWATVPDLRTDPVGHADGQARNACGVVMCLSQATGFPSDIQTLLPDVERARRQMYNMASIICGPEVQPTLPAPKIVAAP